MPKGKFPQIGGDLPSQFSKTGKVNYNIAFSKKTASQPLKMDRFRALSRAVFALRNGSFLK